MHAPRLYICREQHLWLSPERTIYWEEAGSLILSDLHLGKTGHFRKAGIPVPAQVFQEDLQRLFTQVSHYQPKELIVAGDFFHSNHNTELDLFIKWRTAFPDLVIRLIRGNHDILEDDWYQAGNIAIHDSWSSGPFSFVHDREEISEEQNRLFTFTGHLHPGIAMKGPGKQQLRFPCFYFGRGHAILPAYSTFSGLALIEPKKGESVFIIANNQLIQVQ